MVQKRRPLSALLLAFVVVGAACGHGSSNNAPSAIQGVGFARIPTSDLLKAMAGLCTARDQAADPTTAKATFFDESHQAIHDIAAALERVDRTAAGNLLVVKQRAEADLNNGAPAADLRHDLDALAATTHQALATLHINSTPCP